MPYLPLNFKVNERKLNFNPFSVICNTKFHVCQGMKCVYRLPLDYLEEVTTGMADTIFVNSGFTKEVGTQEIAVKECL